MGIGRREFLKSTLALAALSLSGCGKIPSAVEDKSIGVRPKEALRLYKEFLKKDKLPLQTLPYSSERVLDGTELYDEITSSLESSGIREKYEVTSFGGDVAIIPKNGRYAVQELFRTPKLLRQIFTFNKNFGKNFSEATLVGFKDARKYDSEGRIVDEKPILYKILLLDLDMDGNYDSINLVLLPEFEDKLEKEIISEKGAGGKKIYIKDGKEAVEADLSSLLRANPVYPGYWDYTEEEDKKQEYFSKLNFTSLDEIEKRHKSFEIDTHYGKMKFKARRVIEEKDGGAVLLLNESAKQVVKKARKNSELIYYLPIAALFSQIRNSKIYRSISMFSTSLKFENLAVEIWSDYNGNGLFETFNLDALKSFESAREEMEVGLSSRLYVIKFFAGELPENFEQNFLLSASALEHIYNFVKNEVWVED